MTTDRTASPRSAMPASRLGAALHRLGRRRSRLRSSDLDERGCYAMTAARTLALAASLALIAASVVGLVAPVVTR